MFELLIVYTAVIAPAAPAAVAVIILYRLHVQLKAGAMAIIPIAYGSYRTKSKCCWVTDRWSPWLNVPATK